MISRTSRIRKITLYPFDIRLKQPFVISLETITHARNVLVHIQCEDPDLYGWGEASPYQTIQGETRDTQLMIGKGIAKLLVGQDTKEHELNARRINQSLAFNYCIKSAFDMALYDILARLEGRPLYQYLNGKRKILRTDMTVGIAKPEEMAPSARAYIEQGFTEIKIKLGKDPDEDIERMVRVREAAGPRIKLRIDANQGWDPSSALRVLQAIQPLDLEHCEQPVAAKNLTGMQAVNRASPIPIMADESLFDAYDASTLIRMQACSQFNIKLGKSGGIREALKILDLAEEAGIACQVGCFSESRLGITALCHLAMARDSIVYYDMDSPLMLSEDPVIGGVVYQNTNEMHCPDLPGLGLDLDPLFLKNLTRIEID
ncbi:MAG TPA: dipeptide epimerase [Saprospiraceae bacterium]|nr:dipeptide epimerase [Saprospiraceae bacterium]HNT19920.1 dipeptide epimerase [Saprospiraceae bacterium]